MTASALRAAFFDPAGERYGIPTYPLRMAPAGLATRRQLTALGLRPGGQEVAAQLMYRYGRRTCVAWLYEISLAAPKRVPSRRLLASLERAMAARRTCPTCGQLRAYCIPLSLGECLDCHDGTTTDLAGDGSSVAVGAAA